MKELSDKLMGCEMEGRLKLEEREDYYMSEVNKLKESN